MSIRIISILICLLPYTINNSIAQHFPHLSISASLPENIDPNQQYLFYFHGGVVTVQGNNAINQSMPEWGPYEYLNILDSLKNRDFNVISENRKEAVDDSVYVKKLVAQIDSLLSQKVKPDNILVIGASAGWNIVLHASSKLRNKKLRYVIMGGCWPDTYKAYNSLQLRGHFLSIIETTDPHGTCIDIFKECKSLTSYQEIKLNTGLSHGFIYKGHKEWIDPIMEWFRKLKR